MCAACSHFVAYLLGQSLAPVLTPTVPTDRSPIGTLSWQGELFQKRLSASARCRGANWNLFNPAKLAIHSPIAEKARFDEAGKREDGTSELVRVYKLTNAWAY